MMSDETKVLVEALLPIAHQAVRSGNDVPLIEFVIGEGCRHALLMVVEYLRIAANHQVLHCQHADGLRRLVGFLRVADLLEAMM